MIPPAASCRQGGFLPLTNTQIYRQTKLQTLPAVPYGGKARYDALEVTLMGISALCLQKSAEGKRGRVPWRDIWWGQARFASKGADEKEIVYVHKKSDHPPGTGSALGGDGNKKKKKVQEKEKCDE